MNIVGPALFQSAVVIAVLVLSTAPISHLHAQQPQPNSTIAFDRAKIVEFESMLDRLKSKGSDSFDFTATPVCIQGQSASRPDTVFLSPSMIRSKL